MSDIVIRNFVPTKADGVANVRRADASGVRGLHGQAMLAAIVAKLPAMHAPHPDPRKKHLRLHAIEVRQTAADVAGVTMRYAVPPTVQ